MNVSVAPRLTRAAQGLPRHRFVVAEVEAMVETGIMDGDGSNWLGERWFRCPLG
jgi:hypothetical protein